MVNDILGSVSNMVVVVVSLNPVLDKMAYDFTPFQIGLQHYMNKQPEG
jgi:hypothetical protein